MFVRILRWLAPESRSRAPLLGVEALEDRAVPAAVLLLKPDGFGPVPFAVFRPAELPAPPELPGLPPFARLGEPPFGPFVGLGSPADLPLPPREIVAQLRQFAERLVMMAPPLRFPLTHGLFGSAFIPQPVQTSPDPTEEGEPVEQSAPPSVPSAPPLVLVSAVRGESYLRGVLAPDDVGASRVGPALIESPRATPNPPEVTSAVDPIVVTVKPTSSNESPTNFLPFAPLRELARDAWDRVGALPELGLPEDIIDSDAVPEFWQIGVCLVTAATVWAVIPSRGRSRRALRGDGAADPQTGEWSDRGTTS